jgi:hypothetical protein
MKNSLKLLMLAFALVLLVGPTAHASEGRGKLPAQAPSNVAPEVDPSLALCGLTFLGGTLTVLRSRRRK